MSLPYIPLYIDDYEADTAHLSLIEDGSYNRLLRLMWRTPGCSVPDDDAWIFRRMRAQTEVEREAILTVISEFFERRNGRVVSARLLKEFKKADVTSTKRSEAGKKGGRPKAIDKQEKHKKPGFDFDKAGPKHPEPEPDIKNGGGGSARASIADTPTFRERVLSAMGLGPDGIVGAGKFVGTQADMAEAQRWLALPGLTEDVICAEIRQIVASKPDGAPGRFSYFTQPMQRLSATLTAPALVPIRGHPADHSSPQAFPRIRAQLSSEIPQ